MTSTAIAGFVSALLSCSCATWVRLPCWEAQEVFLRGHNDLRRRFGLQDLSWSHGLAYEALDYAQKLYDGAALTHSHAADRCFRGAYAGENLAAGGYHAAETCQDEAKIAAKCVKLWNEEEADYDTWSHKCRYGKLCGHFTQNIWKTTTELGCALTNKSPFFDAKAWQCICHYAPGGNVDGETPLQASYVHKC